MRTRRCPPSTVTQVYKKSTGGNIFQFVDAKQDFSSDPVRVPEKIVLRHSIEPQKRAAK